MKCCDWFKHVTGLLWRLTVSRRATYKQYTVLFAMLPSVVFAWTIKHVCNCKHCRAMIPPDLFLHIVSFLNGEERRTLGFDVATCMRFKLPPTPLSLNPAFRSQLVDLQQRRMWGGVYVYNHDDATIVSVDFVRDDYESEEDDNQQNDCLILYIITHARLLERITCRSSIGRKWARAKRRDRKDREMVSFVQDETAMARHYCWFNESLRYREQSAFEHIPLLRMRRTTVLFR